MRKTVLIIILALFMLSATAYFTFAKLSGTSKAEKPSEYKIGMSLEEAYKDTSKPVLIMFYADWCTYCIAFMPKLEQISKLYKDKINIVMLNGELEENATLMRNFRVAGYPTLYILDPMLDNKVFIPSTSMTNIDFMTEELDRYLRIRELTKCNVATK